MENEEKHRQHYQLCEVKTKQETRDTSFPEADASQLASLYNCPGRSTQVCIKN